MLILCRFFDLIGSLYFVLMGCIEIVIPVQINHDVFLYRFTHAVSMNDLRKSFLDIVLLWFSSVTLYHYLLSTHSAFRSTVL